MHKKFRARLLKFYLEAEIRVFFWAKLARASERKCAGTVVHTLTFTCGVLMQNFSQLTSKLREETEVTRGARDERMLAIQIFPVLVKSSSCFRFRRA